MINRHPVLPTIALLGLLLAVPALAADDAARQEGDPAPTLRDDTVRNWQYELDDFDPANIAAARPDADAPSGAARVDEVAAPAATALIAPEAD